MSDERGAVSDPGAEREVDLRAIWVRLAARWWLPLGGAVVGAIVGVLLSTGGGVKAFEAKTLLYLGQPFTPGGQIQSLATNPLTVSEIVRSEAVLEQTARASGLRVGQLRGHVTTRAVTAPTQTKSSTSPLQEIIVDGPSRGQAQKAAAAFAQAVISQLAGYVDTKITLLQGQIAYDRRSLTSANARIQAALRLQQQALKSKSLQLSDRFLIQANANASLNFYEARQTNLRNDLTNAQQALSVAGQVERSRIVEPAVAVETRARNRRTSLLVGALIGLLLGSLAAYLADPLVARRKAT